MYKIRIFTVGKTKEEWLSQAIQEYTKRLKGSFEFSWMLAANDARLKELCKQEKELICLDPAGRQVSSEEFSDFLMKRLEQGGCTASFLIGGAEGIPDILKRGNPLIALSKLTFTHQMTRAILLEQIYRASEIAKGSSYHK